MAISQEKTTELVSKAKNLILYLGTPSENLGLGLDPDTNCNAQIEYCLEIGGIDFSDKMKDAEGKVISPRVVISVGQIEQDFPGTIALLTQIANHYNPYK